MEFTYLLQRYSEDPYLEALVLEAVLLRYLTAVTLSAAWLDTEITANSKVWCMRKPQIALKLLQLWEIPRNAYISCLEETSIFILKDTAMSVR